MSADYAALLPVAHQAIDLAVEVIRSMRPGVLTAKGDRDMASEVDYTVERRVREFLAARTPDIGFLGEEGGVSGSVGGLLWALDPVDGTVNFVHGSPLYAVSLGLAERRRPRLGIIDLPFFGTRYHAVEGCGAFADGERIRASGAARLSDAVVAIGDYAVGVGSAEKNAERLMVTAALTERVQRIRMHGSAAIDLAWLAHGRLDAVVVLSNNPWDTAAGVVLVSESGARVFDVDGSLHSFDSAATIATTGALRDPLLRVIDHARAGRG